MALFLLQSFAIATENRPDFTVSAELLGRTGAVSINFDYKFVDVVSLGAGVGVLGGVAYANAYLSQYFFITAGVAKWLWPEDRALRTTEDSNIYFFPGVGYESLFGNFLLRISAYARITWADHTVLSPTPSGRDWKIVPWGGVTLGYGF